VTHLVLTEAATAATSLIAAAGLGQAMFGWHAFRRFRAVPEDPPPALPPVTILKPLHGDEPMLEEALASFCAQDYPCFQIVFGLQDPADAALHVLRRIRKRFPALDMEVVVDPTPHGANRKVANLINMLPSARHDMLVIADSDIHAPAGYLMRLAEALLRPGAGLVTTAYVGLPATESLPGQFGASYINHTFLPGALMARRLGRQDCMGATMAVTRQTLELVGGFEALSDHLADDAVLGKFVLAVGLSVELAPTLPATTVPETSLTDLYQHELRWARTIKSVAPLGFALSVVQFPLFWSALSVLLSGGEAWALVLFATIWAFRAAIAADLDRSLGVAAIPAWLVPLRDLFSVAVMLASYASDEVAWRGQVLHASAPPILNPVPSHVSGEG